MKKIRLLLLLLPVYFSSYAQDDEYKEPSKESREYHDYREQLTEPSFGLKKIKGLVGKIKQDEDDDRKLDKKTYAALSLREKFTYHMIHGESYSQNCDAMPPIQDEQKKIFAYLPDAFGEYSWSDRQIKFFKDNKDSVIKLMEEIISKNNKVGVNFKEAIVEMNAKEMIPFLITTYNVSKKDHDILTVLNLLMKINDDAVFLASSSYKKLYGNESNFYAWLNFNKANEDLIIKRATDFYNGLGK
jgi:hypothetical protein